MTKPYNMNFALPDELLFNILILLPVISVLRCKSVCKSWLSIISNPLFTGMHLIESHKKTSSVLKLLDNALFVDTCDDSTLLHMLPHSYVPVYSICSCNGLVCFSKRSADVIYLLNPMTKQFKKLHFPTAQPDSDVPVFLGLGFDYISNDYKILRIALKVNWLGDEVYDCDVEVDLYSTSNDSWKKIQVPEKVKNFMSNRSACVYTRGSCLLYLEGAYQLLSFHLHYEVFTVYPYPIPLLCYKQRRSYVFEFEGSVAIIFNDSTNDGSVSTLWKLHDVPGEWSWTKEFDLEDCLKENQITSLYLGDGHFFASDAGGIYIFSDYKKKSAKKYLQGAFPARLGTIVKYNESLVSLKGFEPLE